MNEQELKDLKLNQIKILDEYKAIALEDESFKKFLVVFATKVNTLLHELDNQDV